MMSKNKVIKSVSLNKTNPDELEIIQKISTKDFNFNGYVKRLILEDMKREKMRASQSGKGGIQFKLG